MIERRDSSDPPSGPDILHVFHDHLSQAARPGTRLSPFLHGVLRVFQTRWPEISRAEIFLRSEEGAFRRAAGVNTPADAPETPLAESPAARALAANALIAPAGDSDPASWAVPLPGGDGLTGVLSLDLPASSPASAVLPTLLPALALPLGLAVELVRAIPLTRALAISRKLPRDCTPADILGAFVNYLGEDAHLPLSLTLYGYEQDRCVRAQTFSRAHPGDGITGESPILADEHPFRAAAPDLTGGQPVIISDVADSPLIPAAREDFQAHHLTALTLIPLTAFDRLVGVLALGGLLPDPAPLPGLQALASQIAVLVQNKTLSEQFSRVPDQADQRATFEESLSRITSRLQQQADLHDLLQHTMHDLGHALGARRARVRLQPLTGPTGTQPPK